MNLLEKKRRTAADAWIDSCDPLNGLSIAQAKAVYNAARRNGSPLLQKIYSEIESADPVLMTCVERSQSALAGLGWRTVADASAADAVLAEEQRRALEEFADGIANLDEAIEHLDLAFFRGHSVVQPIWEGGAVRTVSLLESWNFLRDADGRLLWNPDCSYDPAACEEIPPSAMCVALLRRRAIDWPALSVYIRKHVGERDWGRFLERYGLPPVDAVMGANATEAQRDDYVQAADDARDGRSVVWPAGTTVSRAEGARGQDPFSAFVEHQERQIVLMATGGTLTSLAQADTGSLAGGAQMDVWEQIVQRDGVAISGALHRGLFIPFLRRAFPGRPALARLVLGRETEPTAEEAADLAGKLRAAGYRVDQSQLEEATGFKLERDETQPQPGFGGFGGFANKAAPQDPDSGVAKPLQNARRAGGATDAPRDPETRSDAILRDFAADMGPAAEKIKSLLDALDAGKDVRDEARKLAEELPDLMADDPAMAAVIEEAMADAFAGAAGGGEETVPNKEGECRAQDPAHCPVHGTPEAKADGGVSGAAAETPAKKDGEAKAETAHYTPATSEAVEKFKTELPKDIEPEEFDAILTAGFEDVDGAGNKVKYGTLLRDHINDGSRNEQDRDARKKRLGMAVKMVRSAKPETTETPGKPAERVYTGIVDGKAFIAVADEHDEIDAMEMVSYRRGKKKEVRNA